MYARVAAFENRDPSLTDELIGRVREGVERGQPVPEAQGGLMLVERERGRALGITFFRSEEQIREAADAFDRMGDDFPEQMRGRRTSVETYEVLHSEGGEGAKAARVSLLEGSSDRIDEGARGTEEEILPQVRQLAGFKGALTLVDRERGRTKIITLWESDQALRSSEEQANQLRQRAAEGAAARIVGVERYEVGVARIPAAV